MWYKNSYNKMFLKLLIITKSDIIRKSDWSVNQLAKDKKIKGDDENESNCN